MFDLAIFQEIVSLIMSFLEVLFGFFGGL